MVALADFCVGASTLMFPVTVQLRKLLPEFGEASIERGSLWFCHVSPTGMIEALPDGIAVKVTLYCTFHSATSTKALFITTMPVSKLPEYAPAPIPFHPDKAYRVVELASMGLLTVKTVVEPSSYQP